MNNKYKKILQKYDQLTETLLLFKDTYNSADQNTIRWYHILKSDIYIVLDAIKDFKNTLKMYFE